MATIETQMPFLVNMDPVERRSMAKAGDRSQAFVRKALDLATDTPDILPRDFDLREFEKDVELADKLTRFQAQLVRLQERVRNTIIAAQADAYQQALEVYHRTKRTKREGFADLTRELGRRFKRKATKAEPETAQA